MAQFTAVPAPTGVEISLRVKTGIAAGSARRFLVGDPTIQRIDTLVGSLLVRMAAAEKQARQGEVVVSREVAASLGDALRVREWRDGEQYAVVGGLTVAVEPTPWPTLTPEALPAELSRQWMLPAVYEQLQSGTTTLGDLRPVTPLMLQFGGIDLDGDEAAGEKLNAFISWAQRIIHHHGGVLLELVVGDKGAFIYAPFGAPLAHENDPARAMRAALALRDLPPDLAEFITPLQIGLTRGEVWTGNCGGNGRYTYGVMGSDVSLAARLMSKAEPGQILVSSRMSHYPGFQREFIGDLTVKGFDLPIPTYSLLGEGVAEEQAFSTPMVGRTAELQQLTAFAQPLSEGKLAGTAVIYGEPGIGKSRLAYALRQRLAPPQSPPVGGKQRGEISWFTGQTDQILRQAFNPFVYWLKSYFQQSPDHPEAQNKDRFNGRFQSLIANLQSLAPNPHPLIAELVRTQSFLGALLGLHWDGSLYQQLDDPKLRYQNTVTAVKTLILAESRLRPVVFELEDGHWLDESSHHLLLTLSRKVSAYPLLILITSRYRDDGTKPPFALAEETPSLTLDLATLSREALEEQAVAILGGTIAPSLLTLLWERSHANPFFAEQLLLHFQETGALGQTAVGDWILTTTPSDLPADVNTMLIARIDRLAHQVKAIVQAAAVLGREFEVRLLARMLVGQDVSDGVQTAEREQIWSLLRELRYIFKHALLRDAAYEMQLRTQLKELHYLAARTLESLYPDRLAAHDGELAYHYEAAYQYGQYEAREPAVNYLYRTGEKALASSAYRQALHDTERALALQPDENSVRAALLIQAGGALTGLGELSEAHDRLAEGLSLARKLGDTRSAAFALGRLSYIANDQGDWDTARAQLAEGLALARQIDDQSQTAYMSRMLGWVDIRQGMYPEAQARLAESRALFQSLGDQQGQAHTLNGLGAVASEMGDYPASQSLYLESLALYQGVGNRDGEATVLINLGEIARLDGAYAEARQYYQEGLKIAREIDSQGIVAINLGNLGHVASALADYHAAVAYYHEALRLTMEMGYVPLVLDFLAGLANVLAHTGQPERANELLGVALHHPALVDETRQEHVAPLLADLRAQFPEDEVEAGLARGQARELAEVVAEVTG